LSEAPERAEFATFAPRRGIEDREKGAVLLLALAYIIAVSVIVGALAYWATNDLNNTTAFFTGSQQAYAANAATVAAVQSIRSTPDPYYPTTGLVTTTSGPVTVTGYDHNGVPYNTTPGECWTPLSGAVSSVLIHGVSMTVWCTTVEDLTQSAYIEGAVPTGTRIVTFYTCLSSVQTGAQCEQAPLVTAVVAFNDYSGATNGLLNSQCNVANVSCGVGGATEVSWTSVKLPST